MSMRLTQMLLKWPRRRPNGSIWIGKDQMVRLVREKNQKKLNKQIEMAMAARDTNEQKLEHLLFMCVQCTFSNLC